MKKENLESLFDALPKCHIVGCCQKATFTRKVGFGSWYLCDDHGDDSISIELPYARALRNVTKN